MTQTMLDLVLRRDRDGATQSDLAALSKRVEKLEAGPKPKAKDGWDILQLIASASSPLILVALAFLLTGRVETALKERTLEVATVKEMQSLILQIVKPETGATATGAAVGLAAYGRSAVGPMCDLLRSPNQSVVAAAEEGLKTIGARDPEAVCPALTKILGNRMGLYSYETHHLAVRLIAQLQCSDAKAALQDYQRVLSGGVGSVQKVTAPNPPVDDEALEILRSSVQNALQSVR